MLRRSGKIREKSLRFIRSITSNALSATDRLSEFVSVGFMRYSCPIDPNKGLAARSTNRFAAGSTTGAITDRGYPSDEDVPLQKPSMIAVRRSRDGRGATAGAAVHGQGSPDQVTPAVSSPCVFAVTRFHSRAGIT